MTTTKKNTEPVDTFNNDTGCFETRIVEVAASTETDTAAAVAELEGAERAEAEAFFGLARSSS